MFDYFLGEEDNSNIRLCWGEEEGGGWSIKGGKSLELLHVFMAFRARCSMSFVKIVNGDNLIF